MTVQGDEQLAARAVEARAYEEAVRLLLPLAELSSEYALLTLGWVYETGATGLSDREAAQSYYERAAAGGSASGYLYLGWLLLNQGEESQARAAFEAGARLGNNECASVLTRLNDNVVEHLAIKTIEAGEYEEAVRLLQPLADRNVEYALLTLGWIYETGAMGASDKDAARLYYERAASEGSASAYFDLGRLFSAQDEEALARSAFEAGAERGDISSMSKLGRMMIEGRGGPIDIEGGSAWLEKAAGQGHIFAQRILLGLKLRDAKSMSEKLSLRMKILLLAKKGAKEMLKDPRSDKLR
jgi:TPR repeat protein